MRCGELRAWMLDAPGTDLERPGDTRITGHLRGCAACRTAVRGILREERELGRALDAVLPRTPVDEALARLRDAEATAATSRPHRSGRFRRRARWWSVPAAAAAVWAALSLSSVAERPFPASDADPGSGSVAPTAVPSPFASAPSLPPARPPRPAPQPAPQPAPLVEATVGEAVAVFATSNPNITVAWIYQEPIE
jgi:hypothetical protein